MPAALARVPASASRRVSTRCPSIRVLPPPPEEKRRFPKSRPGSKAEADLVQQYLPLVKTVVNRMAMTLPPHVDTEDLYSSGLVGLLNAVRNFNPHCGSSFASYARVRIRGAILDELRKLDWVPRSIHTKARQVQTVMQQLEQTFGAPPTEVQMAKALKMTVAEYEKLLEEVRPATFVCLDAITRSDDLGDDTRHESIADDAQANPVDATVKREVARLIVNRVEKLPAMQRKVLALYYFEDLRLREIAEAMGVTESRICQVHSQAILSIRSYLQTPEAPRLEL